MTMEMSKDCKYFVQHAWKQDLCANCFESREDHWKKLKQLNICVPGFVTNVKGILRQHENNKKQCKNVVFRASLTEIIGYGGGDDDIYDYCEYNPNSHDETRVKNFYNGADDDNNDNDENRETAVETRLFEHNISNSNEEDRALNNITRSNTNFNRITANLNESSVLLLSSSDTEKTAPKCFNNLMLGNIQKDSEGKKKTLLVSVMPFGANTNLHMISAGKSVDVAPIDDGKKRITPMKAVEIPNIESHRISTSVSNHRSSKLNETSETKCQKVSESIVGMKFNYNEQINEDLSFDILKNNDVNMENGPTADVSMQSVTSSVEHVGMNSGVPYPIESMDDAENFESPRSENQRNDEINDLKFCDDKIFGDTPSNSSSVDCSTIDTSPESSIISPKPRNSFLHGGKNIDDSENTSIKSDEINGIVNSSSCSNQSKNNLTNIEIRNQITPKLPEKLSEDLPSSIFTRKPASSLKSDCPVVREKEKRERATSCSPKFRNMDDNSVNRNYNNEMPESMSKRCATRSLSRHSSSSYSQVLSNTNGVDEETKKKNKTRFSLKRLLRIGSSKKDLNITTADSFVENINNTTPISQFKNKPEIIHPLELNGAAVEILYHDKLIKISDEITYTKSSNVKIIMREPPPPPPTDLYSSKSDCHQLSTNKSTGLSLHDGHESTKMSTPDTNREHPSCHSITSTTTSTTHSITADPIHTGIHNFGKFRPIQCS